MKMVKKILLGLAVLAATMVVTGCMKNDDEKGAIKGSGNKYTVSYTNDTTEAYRAYKVTKLKHAGALVKVTFNAKDMKTSKFGLMFDVQDAVSGVKDADGKKARDFYIIGYGMEGGGNYYLSRYTNIVDIQATNFGASTTATGNEAKEVEFVKYTSAGNITFPQEGDTVTFYAYYTSAPGGLYTCALLNLTDEEAAAYDKTTGEMPASWTSKILKDKKGSPVIAVLGSVDATITNFPQNYIGFYTQVAPGATVSGTYNVIGTFKELL